MNTPLQVVRALSRSTIDTFIRRDSVDNLCTAVRWMTVNLPLLDDMIESHTKNCEPITLKQFAGAMDWFACDVKRFETCCPGVSAVCAAFKVDQGVRDTLSYALKLRGAYATDIAAIKVQCAIDARETKAEVTKKFNFQTPIAESGCTRDEWLSMLREIDDERARLKKRERELDEVVCAATALECMKRCIDCPVVKRTKQ